MVAPELNESNSTESWGVPTQLELWHKLWLRKRLLRILGQVGETNHHLSMARRLEKQGADGTQLVRSALQGGGGGAGVALSGPPDELFQLLEVEGRIRRLRHLHRISQARTAAARSAARLRWLRRHPLRRAAVRTLQAAGTLTAAGVAGQAVWQNIAEKAPLLLARPRSGLKPGHEDVSREGAHAQRSSLDAMLDLVVRTAMLRALRGSVVVRRSTALRVPDVGLDQVAGIGPAKAEALEIVECLMAPARFAGVGAKCPKGLLLTGPPGCGKTLLAKAIASTASVPFISRSGADFNRVYAGAGSAMVKELFKSARSVAPAVILIDELDYIGRRRGEERGGGLETDRSAALTQLLAEMDGFASAEGVVVIGTTNRADILDKALLRPGRFDRHVRVPLPDVAGRQQILQTHGQRLPMEQNQNRKLTGPIEDKIAPVDWTSWAKRTPGFSGADLAGLVNEAAMAAAREGARGVSDRHVQLAYSKALLGVPSGRRLSVAELNLTAAHEAGHAVVNEAMRRAFEVEGQSGFRTVAHMSIIPAGGTGGVTQFQEPEEGQRMPETRRVLLAELAVAMGGRAAEEVQRGRGEATMGARSDFDDATRMATEMVRTGGLSEVVGPRSLHGELSEEMRRKIDAEVDRLLRSALDMARATLARNKGLHAAVTQALLKNETMDGDSFRRIVKEHGVQAAAGL